MTADVFASLQALPNPQTIQPAEQQTPSDGTASQPGLFAALMNECIAEGEAADFPVQMFTIPEEVCDFQAMTFTGSNAFPFPQSVMNILAGEAENSPDTPSPETISLTENALPSQEITDDSDKVFWPDDETDAELPKAPETTELPKNTQAPQTPETATLTGNPEPAPAENIPPENPEHVLADEIAPEFHEHVHAENITPEIPDSPVKSDTLKPSDDTEDSHESEEPHDTEEPQEIPEVSAEFAALAGVMTPQPQISAHTEIHGTQTQPERSAVLSQQTRQRRVQPETHTATREQQNVTENREVNTNFREAAVNRNADPENSGQDSQQEPQNNNQNQNQSQSQNQTQTRKTDSRNLKTDSAAQTPAAESRRTESRSDFAAYFEGVLNSRRSTARVSEPMPLNLRSAENFSQAQALRDGLTNIVRFIRADGVQKARVVVDPPALGRISVELTSGTSGVEASIKVASEQIRQLVQDQISQLRMNLSQQGVQIAEFTVDVQQDNSGNHGQQGQENNAGRFGFVDDSDDDEAEDFRIDLNEGLLYWVA